eukprot:scaffold17584_cov71-Skeletonema_dohrnii-CCMP3373.AAC.3
MDRRDDNYYEANASDISLEDITSSEHNARILRWLRDGDDNLSHLSLCREEVWWNYFRLGEGDDLGWLGYFIGKSVKLQCLEIQYLPEDDGGEQQMHPFSDGIARNQSIQKVIIDNVSNNGFAAIARALGNLSHLEELVFKWYNSNGGLNVNGCSALGTLLESGVSKLKQLRLDSSGIDDAGVVAFASGLRSIGPSLKELYLGWNFIGNEGLSALVAALANCTSLERLNLSDNDFSSAAAGLRSLSDWLQREALNLDELRLRDCDINDEGLQAMAGTVNHCKDLDLSSNQSITASGLKYLSASLQSENCCLENLYLGWMDTVNGGAEVLARGLVGNKVLRRLHLRIEDQDDIEIPPAGWDAFSKALCDTSTINNTYLSNHIIQELYYWDNDDYDSDNEERFILDEDERVVQYLQLNKEHPEHAARCKILMNHTHLDMTPLLQWELKCLPLAVGWFEKAQPCTALSIDELGPDYEGQVLEESEEAFQSRVLTAVYEFVRGMTEKVLERRDELALVAAYDDKIAMAAMVKEESDRKISQLEEENKRLRGIMKSMRNALDKALEE